MAAEPLRVTYGIYAGGFHVMDMQGIYTLQDDGYDLKMDMKTVGMLGALAPWSGVIVSNGVNKDIESFPRHHQFVATWRGKDEITTFTFDEKGDLTSYILREDDGTVKDEMPVAEVMAGSPVDMLSALFRVMNNDTCEMSPLALDGKRSFEMVFTSKGEVMMEPSRYSVYSGPAEICEIEIVPVAGKWREKPRGWMSLQGQAKGKGQLPRLWFGRVRDDMPPIPVRFTIKTDYGSMLMHLQGVGEKTL
jgi:hypothetical protein